MEAAMIVYGLFAGLLVVILAVIFVAAGISAVVRGWRRLRAGPAGKG
ncbi:MAG TPA: hypothetical protein VKS22_14775 [Candidatus Binataceae bacterium]|nr:hypothetical protein [Candidatus Binataceae bacterium]